MKQLHPCGNGRKPGESLILLGQTTPEENLPIAHPLSVSPDSMLDVLYRARGSRLCNITARMYAYWSE